MKHKLIAEQEVSNAPVDMGLLTETAKAACETLGISTIDMVAGRPRFLQNRRHRHLRSGRHRAACAQAAARTGGARRLLPQGRVPLPRRSGAYLCPGGQVLATRTESKLRDLKKVDYSNRHACYVCPLQPRCTTRFRKVSRIEGEKVLERMAERLKARPELLDLRRQSVEHPFCSIKQWMNQGVFLMRRLPTVRLSPA